MWWKIGKEEFEGVGVWRVGPLHDCGSKGRNSLHLVEDRKKVKAHE